MAFARHLSLSPDGQTLAFSWAGDIWTVAIDGGLARRLTVNPAHETRPVWSRDGELIAFSSDRHGADNVFVMNRDGGGIRRLTFDDRSAAPTDWSPDDEYVIFHARREGEVFWEPRVYRVHVDGGQPARLLECHAAEARVSANGDRTAFTRGRSRWWRKDYRGTADYDVWIHDRTSGEFTLLTEFDGMDRLPCWDATGDGVFFISDRDGTSNVWYQPLGGAPARQLTFLEEDEVRDLAVAPDGGMLVFTHWDKLYTLELSNGEPRELQVTAGTDKPYTQQDWRTFRRGADEAEVSPDGEEIALVVRGEIFVIKTKPDKPTRRVTDSAARDQQVIWSPDGKALFFTSDRTGVEQIYRARSAEKPRKALSESLRFKIEQVTDHSEPCYAPRLSPDGKQLAYVRQRGDLVIRDLKSGDEKVLFESWNIPAYQWSPDSKWIAYSIEDIEHNSDVWIRRADGTGDPVNISRHPDYDGNPQWSADGNIVTFASQRHGFDSDIYLVFLTEELHERSSVALDEYFEETDKAAKKRKPLKSAVASGKIKLAGAEEAAGAADDAEPEDVEGAEDDEAEEEPLAQQLRSVLKQLLDEPEPDKRPSKKDAKKKAEREYDLDSAYRRIRRVTRLPEGQAQHALAPDGALIAFTSGHEGNRKLYTIKWNGRDQKEIGSGVGALHWDLKGSRLYYLSGGVPGSKTASGGGSKRHEFVAKMTIDFRAEAAQKFNDGARTLGRNFYHPTLKGLDWDALTDKYRALAVRTHTLAEFNEVFNMLLGELNGSHLGIYGGERRVDIDRQNIGYLGLAVDPDHAGDGLKITRVTPNGPADREESKLRVGDVILTVNGEKVGAGAPLDRALIDSVGEEVILEYRPGKQPEAATGADATTPAAEEAGEADADTAADGEPARPQQLIIRPISYGQLVNLEYDAWVLRNREYVHAQTDGRVGYVHIRGMNVPSFEVFERDLYAAAHGKDGLIIDVRNNGGGWTADWVLAVLSVKRHAYTVPRGAAERGYPQGRLIFYAWTKPATMMCNQYSYSNAEIVSHAFKNLGRGPLVGMTTFGAVISTGGYRLIDGALVRMPFRGWWTLPFEEDMDVQGAEPDIKVPETPADEAAGRFPQLDAAIRATLEQVEADAELAETP